ncbi:hypothetical protein [Pseudomonas sp.]|uniref:hypothetical protein n=1 Tax=Pseudomonas sp. TaxID=306 RepID=UPI00290A35E3|nr:hypothetical protein [Pseudomonas sp.]MDU4249053.1 hypothetical protein [Pseudomonas sp.]
MNDTELLTLAAKASGMEPPFDSLGGLRAWVGSADGGHWWNPLEDDGDALRLAVKLDIHVKRYAGSTTAQELGSVESHTEHDHWPQNDNDQMSSTRRAIVTAAAKIGRTMP